MLLIIFFVSLCSASVLNQLRAAQAASAPASEPTITAAPEPIRKILLYGTTSADPTITTAPSPVEAVAAACTPSSVCVDYLTCGQRLGECYDQNNCTATASRIVLPTCSSTPGSGLKTQKVKKIMEIEDGDHALPVVPT